MSLLSLDYNPDGPQQYFEPEDVNGRPLTASGTQAANAQFAESPEFIEEPAELPILRRGFAPSARKR